MRISIRANELTVAAQCTFDAGKIWTEIKVRAIVDEATSMLKITESQSNSATSPDGKGKCSVNIKASELKYELRSGSLYFTEETGKSILVSDNKIAD